MYDPKAVETITGEVTNVDRISPAKGMSGWSSHECEDRQGNDLGSSGSEWYIENQDVKMRSQRQGRGEGSRITFDGKPAMIAAEVKKGEEVLKLRDDNGFPVWSGWRRR